MTKDGLETRRPTMSQFPVSRGFRHYPVPLGDKQHVFSLWTPMGEVYLIFRKYLVSAEENINSSLTSTDISIHTHTFTTLRGTGDHAHLGNRPFHITGTHHNGPSFMSLIRHNY